MADDIDIPEEYRHLPRWDGPRDGEKLEITPEMCDPATGTCIVYLTEGQQVLTKEQVDKGKETDG